MNWFLSLQLSSPQFAERLGMYVTLGVPCYSKEEVWILSQGNQKQHMPWLISIYHSFIKYHLNWVDKRTLIGQYLLYQWNWRGSYVSYLVFACLYFWRLMQEVRVSPLKYHVNIGIGELGSLATHHRGTHSCFMEVLWLKWFLRHKQSNKKIDRKCKYYRWYFVVKHLIYCFLFLCLVSHWLVLSAST